MYNKNYLLKNVGYFQNYIYKYKNYAVNTNILEPFLLENKSYIIYIMYKNGFQENLTGICYFTNYIEFLKLLESSLSQKLMQLDRKEINGLSIIIKVWIYKQIALQRQIKRDQEIFNKKLIKFQKVLEKLIDYKVKTNNKQQEYSRFLTDKILNKELKPVLHIKVIDEDMQMECLKHVLNLMSKKWPGITHDTFKYWIKRTIKLYQDNFEHNDKWEIDVKNKKNVNTQKIKSIIYMFK